MIKRLRGIQSDEVIEDYLTDEMMNGIKNIIDTRATPYKKAKELIGFIEDVLIMSEWPQDIAYVDEHYMAYRVASKMQQYREDQNLPKYNAQRLLWLKQRSTIVENIDEIDKQFGVDIEEVNPTNQWILVRKFIDKTIKKEDFENFGLEPTKEPVIMKAPEKPKPVGNVRLFNAKMNVFKIIAKKNKVKVPESYIEDLKPSYESDSSEFDVNDLYMSPNELEKKALEQKAKQEGLFIDAFSNYIENFIKSLNIRQIYWLCYKRVFDRPDYKKSENDRIVRHMEGIFGKNQNELILTGQAKEGLTYTFKSPRQYFDTEKTILFIIKRFQMFIENKWDLDPIPRLTNKFTEVTILDRSKEMKPFRAREFPEIYTVIKEWDGNTQQLISKSSFSYEKLRKQTNKKLQDILIKMQREYKIAWGKIFGDPKKQPTLISNAEIFKLSRKKLEDRIDALDGLGMNLIELDEREKQLKPISTIDVKEVPEEEAPNIDITDDEKEDTDEESSDDDDQPLIPKKKRIIVSSDEDTDSESSVDSIELDIDIETVKIRQRERKNMIDIKETLPTNLNAFLDKFHSKRDPDLVEQVSQGILDASFFLHLLKKYPNTCFIINHKTYEFEFNIYRDGQITLPLVKSSFLKKLKKCGEEGKFVLIPFVYRRKEGGGAHANMLIYNPFLNIIEHYEPHGSYPSLQDLDFDLIQTKVREFFAPIEYKSPNLTCPLDNVQTFEMERDGFCLAWSWFLADLRLQNIDKEPYIIFREAIKKMKAITKDFSRIIVQYQNGILNEIGDKTTYRDFFKYFREEIDKINKRRIDVIFKLTPENKIVDKIIENTKDLDIDKVFLKEHIKKRTDKAIIIKKVKETLDVNRKTLRLNSAKIIIKFYSLVRILKLIKQEYAIKKPEIGVITVNVNKTGFNIQLETELTNQKVIAYIKTINGIKF